MSNDNDKDQEYQSGRVQRIGQLLQSIILDFTYRKRTYRVLCVFFRWIKREMLEWDIFMYL